MDSVKSLLLAATLMGAVSAGVAADRASAIAVGSDNVWAWATRTTQKEADKIALELCNSENPKKDCRIDVVVAIVRAESAKRTGYGTSSISIADAKKLALDSCNEKTCKVTDVVTSPGFFSLAKSQEDDKGNSLFHLAYQYSNMDKSDADSVQHCQDRSGRKCSVIMKSVIPGIYKVADNPAPARDVADCRPRTQVLRCTSQCTNGNCVVTYENGCRISVQVTPRFDPFTNQWTYPSPSC